MLLSNPSSITAIAKIEPSIGPMQGVQPTANDIPIMNGKNKLLENFFNVWTFVLFNKPILKKPKSCEANTIIINPATILISSLYKNIFDTKEAAAPKETKTNENPNENKIVLNNTLCFFWIKTSNSCPAIKEMYPGINGNTQGDKKLINPAKKAIDNVVFIKKITRLLYYIH